MSITYEECYKAALKYAKIVTPSLIYLSTARAVGQRFTMVLPTLYTQFNEMSIHDVVLKEYGVRTAQDRVGVRFKDLRYPNPGDDLVMRTEEYTSRWLLIPKIVR